MEVINGKIVLSRFDEVRAALLDPTPEGVEVRKYASSAAISVEIVSIALAVSSIAFYIIFGIPMIGSKNLFTSACGCAYICGSAAVAVGSYDIHRMAGNFDAMVQNPLIKGFVVLNPNNFRTVLFNRTVLLERCFGDAVEGLLNSPGRSI